MNYKIICETDADFLLDFKMLEDGVFGFVYAKWEKDTLQQFVNCNGKVFGPFEMVGGIYDFSEKVEWTGYKGDSRMDYTDNGNKCEIEKRTNKLEVLSQKEIDILLSVIEEPKAKKHRKNNMCFETDKKTFGPYYQIYESESLDDEHFHFTYAKRENSKRWYYNYNGKEFGPFYGIGYFNIRYDNQKRAILDSLSHNNFIIINGEKRKCFDGSYHGCKLYNYNGHEIFTGYDSNGYYHFKKDGIEPDFRIKGISVLDNGDIVYSKIEDETETWFYNDTPISVTVNGSDSKIINSILLYNRWQGAGELNIPYFMVEGTEYQGVIVTYYNPGDIFWLQDGKVLYSHQEIPSFKNPSDKRLVKKYEKTLDGNFLRLFYTHSLAGRD